MKPEVTKQGNLRRFLCYLPGVGHDWSQTVYECSRCWKRWAVIR